MSLLLAGCAERTLVTTLPVDNEGNRFEVVRHAGGGAAGTLAFELWQVGVNGDRFRLLTAFHATCLSMDLSDEIVTLYYPVGTRIEGFTNLVYFSAGNEYEIIASRVAHKCPGKNLLN